MGTAREKRTVLVVEDDPWVRLVEVELLTGNGYTVLQASNGHTALLLAERHEPDIILLDLALPEMAGSEVLNELRSHRQTREIPVIIVSAHPEMLGEAARHGAQAVLTKPFNFEVLLNEVDQAVSRRSLRLVRRSGSGVA